MLLDFLRSLLVFLGVTLGLAWPLAARLRLDPAEKLLASAALSLLGVFLCAWLVYVCALPVAALWALPALAAAGLVVGRRALGGLWRDGDARGLVIAQLLVAGWCVGWLATVASYSGGGWAADWFEHWERARFFLVHGALDQKFLGLYVLPARPPLANVVTGAFLALTRVDFAHYQLVSTLLASLAFLPAALLARRFRLRQVPGEPGGGPRAVAVLAVFFMVSPLFVQNATFAWTKLPAAFFVLTALVFFLRVRDPDAPRAAVPLLGACLAAGLLAHYSAGPYAVVLAGLWLGFGWAQRRDPTWWRASATAALAGALVLAVWLGWSLANYGAAGTFFSNTSVTSRDVHEGNLAAKIALNLLDTVVPHFLRTFDTSLIAQRSAWGSLRDWFFQCYQVNLPLAFGSVAWLAIVRELVRGAKDVAARTKIFWAALVAGVAFLGVATHGARDHWGLAHVCLQALVLLGLAFLASRWHTVGRPWQLALMVGAAVDLAFGIALQFAVESYALDRWFGTGPPGDLFKSYNETAFMNLAGKIQNQLAFFSDVFASPPALVLALLAAILMLGLARARPAASRTA